MMTLVRPSVVHYAVFFAVLAAACLLTGGRAESPVTERHDKVVIALPPPSPETNRIWLGSSPSYIQAEPYLESLLSNDPVTGETTPSLAVSWEHSEDRREWTFQLREGVQFHHGWGEFTSADVLHSHRLWSDPASAEQFQSLWAHTEVEANGPYEVTFRFPSPEVFGPDLFDRRAGIGFIFSHAQYEAEGLAGIDAKPTGTGRYMYVDRSDGEKILFERNPDHWSGTLGHFRQIEMRWEPEGSTRLALVRTGEADIAEVARELHRQAEAAGLEILRSPRLNYQAFLIFGGMHLSSAEADTDLSFPWLADARVRGAFNLAINRDEIIEYIYDGDAVPLYNTGMVEGEEGWNDAWVTDYDEYYGYDPERAVELIREAGYEPADLKPTLMSFEIPGSPEWGPLQEAVQLYLFDIGITAEILETDFATYSDIALARRSAGYIIPLRNTPIRRPHELFRALAVSGTIYTFYATDETDALVAEWGAETDTERRHELARQVGDNLYYDWGTMPIAQLQKALVVNPDSIGGWTFPGLTSAGLTHFELIEPAE